MSQPRMKLPGRVLFSQTKTIKTVMGTGRVSRERGEEEGGRGGGGGVTGNFVFYTQSTSAVISGCCWGKGGREGILVTSLCFQHDFSLSLCFQKC